MSHPVTPPAARSGPIQVMVVDDSFVIRALLSRSLENDAEVNVLCTAGDGQKAVDELKRRDIDVIVLDIEMPVMDGLTAIPLLLQADPFVQIVVASTLTHKNAEISLKAMKAGATDYLTKPSTSGELNNADAFKRNLLSKVKELGVVSRRRRLGNIHKSGSAQSALAKPVKKEIVLHKQKNYPRPNVIAIGSSTGGPQALFTFLGLLKGRVTQPIVITQHMPPTFTSILANHITQQTGIPCIEGAEGMILEGGKAYVAPGDYHMTFVREGLKMKIKLEQTPPVNFCRPAVDVMIDSLMTVADNKILAVILTGLGADGRNACVRLFEKGGAVFAQDEITSVVWGMPGAVAQAGICADVLPISHLATAVERLAR